MRTRGARRERNGTLEEMISKDVLCLHMRYARWAAERILEAAATLTPAELTHDFKTSEKHVTGTLAHIFAADRVWWHRVRRAPLEKFIDPEKDFRLETLRAEWPALLLQWEEFLAAQDETALAGKIEYKDLKGNSHTAPLWQIVLHVVNHGTHHRGQVSGMMRAQGHVPPPLDLIAFYRTLG
ncbi:MAG: DinB family protein [Bryobacterales bacterium]|nr:DinB family protein [Bryobacterales bacterium]